MLDRLPYTYSSCVVRRRRIIKRGVRQASCISGENAEKVCHAKFLVIAVVLHNHDSGRQLEAPFEHVGEHHNVDRPCFKMLDLRWFERPKQTRMVRTFLKVHTRPWVADSLRFRGY
jgi:hypothetical protein